MLFFMKFCKKGFLEKQFQKMIVQNSAVQRGQLCFFVVVLFARWRKQFALTPFEIYTELNEKCACTNETAVRNLCNDRLGVLC